MKNGVNARLLVSCLLFLSFSISSYAQSDDLEKTELIKMAKKPFKERLSLSPSIGWLHSWGDFKKDGFMPSFLQSDANEFGFGLNLNYGFNRYFTVSTGILIGELGGSLDNVETRNAVNNSVDFGRGIRFETNLFEFTLPRIDLNLTRLIFKDKVNFFNKASIGLFASHGLVFYDSKIYAQSGSDQNLIYSKERGRTGKTTEGVTSFGGSFAYMINDKFDLGIESSIRNVYNDKLDAWIAGDHNDRYSYTAVTLTYHFKRRSNNQRDVEKDKLLAEKPGQSELESEVEETPVLEEEEVVEEVEDKTDFVADPELEGETVFGAYDYDKLPMSNTAIVVFDEDGNAIDTIYTDQYGKFQYTKLSADQKVTFYPLDASSLDDDKIELYAEEKSGKVVQDKKNTFKGEVAKVEPTKKETPKVNGITGYRYYVVVAAYKGESSTDILMKRLRARGENPEVIRNLEDTWNLVTIGLYPSKAEALSEMRKARENGYNKAWVHILPPVK